jgi:hypothetical protein
MKVSFITAGIAAVAVFAGVYWFARDRAPAPAAEIPGEAPATPPADANPADAAPPSAALPPTRPAVNDARLEALIGPPDDAMVEYRAGPDGRVIQEVDNDPNSPGYRQPLRDYSYVGGQVAAITVYKYLGDQVQVIRATASYKPDGSIDQYNETTEYRKPD